MLPNSNDYDDINSTISKKVEEKNPKLFWLSPIKELFLFLTGAIFISIIALIVSFIVGSFYPGITEKSPEYIMMNVIIDFITYLTIVIIMCLIIFIPKINKTLFSAFKDYRNYITGLTVTLLLVGFNVLYSIFLEKVIHVGINQNESLIRDMIKNMPFLTFLTVVILGPISEELTYRVGLFNLITRWKKIWAYILVSILFALIHFDFFSKDIVTELWNIPSYLFAGILLCYAYDKGGLAASLTAHLSNNLISFILQVI